MNFMRDTFSSSNRKRKVPYSRIKDINFFQTVREGSRSYHSRKAQSGGAPNLKTVRNVPQSGGSSFSGRMFIRPAKKSGGTLDSSFTENLSSVASILESATTFTKPDPPSISSKPLTAEECFFSSVLESPPSKRAKFQSFPSWKYPSRNKQPMPSSSPSTSVTSNKSSQGNIEYKKKTYNNTSLFIEDTAEEKCNQFRKTCQDNAAHNRSVQNTSLYIEETAEEKCSEFRQTIQRSQDNNEQNTSLYIEETAEEQCNQYRADMEKMMIHRRSIPPLLGDNFPDENKLNTPAREDSPIETPQRFQPPSPITPRQSSFAANHLSANNTPSSYRGPKIVTRNLSPASDVSYHSRQGVSTAYAKDVGVSEPQTPQTVQIPPEMSPFKSVSPGLQNLPSSSGIHPPKLLPCTPSPILSSREEPNVSPSVNTNKCFFSTILSESGKAGGSSSKEESFFKIPELPSSCGSGHYDNLFATPGRVKSLPRITTPQLFLPYNKTTPSKPTPSQTKSSLKTPSSQESFYVISITEGRGHAVCEVGIAAIDLNHPALILSQFSDSQTYKKTLAKINIIDPAEMIIPDTFKGLTPSVLYTTVSETFQEMRVITVKRQHFSAKHGMDSIRALLLPDCSSIEMIIHRKYYALAASEALLKYIEIRHGIILAPKSLKVSYESAKDIVSIDLETCQRLELVMCNAEMVCPEKYSLFGLLNHTKTLGGKRRLRVSLLQPSSSAEVINERQNSVTALVNDQRSLEALQASLLKFSSVERLLWLCLKTPNFKNEAKTFEMLTNYVLLLKGSLEAVPHLRQVLQDIDDDHIINIRDELSDNRYDALLVHIHTMIQEDARPARGHAEAEKQRCFAIKDGINDLLDVARATYSDLIQMVMDNISELSREYSLPLKMTQTSDLGFHPSYLLPKHAQFSQQEIPEIFTEVKLKNRTVHLLTEELYTYNMRIKRAMQEIQLITNVVIYDLVESLREEVNLVYRLCDHISDLDMLACIAQLSSSPDYTKPTFTEEMSVVGARHPILDHIRPTKPIPNNIFASKKKNFNLITGPNMGGKTVYILMIPLIQIMAQIGCYVPADKAELRITDHIYVKKGNLDSIECGLSSFTKEIKELNYTLENLSDRSLIILDEICTGTLVDEGTALAWGYCEEFLKRPIFTFLTTHYHYLTNLAKIYKNVTNYNMEAIERCASSMEDSGLTFTYRLLPGTTTTTNYGLRLMMASGLPIAMKKNALDIAEDMLKKRAEMLPLVVPETPMTAGLTAKCEKLENFMSNLYGLSMTENFTTEIVRTLQKMALEEILSEADEDEEAAEKTRLEEGEQSSRDKNNSAESSNEVEPHSVENQDSLGIKTTIKMGEEDCRVSEQLGKSGGVSDRSGSGANVSAKITPLPLISATPASISQAISLPSGLPRVTSPGACTTDKPQLSAPTRPRASPMTPFRLKTPTIMAAEFSSCPITSFKTYRSSNTSSRDTELHPALAEAVPAGESLPPQSSSIPLLPASATPITVSCSFAVASLDRVVKTPSGSTRAAGKVISSGTPENTSSTTSPKMFTPAKAAKTPATSATSASASYCTADSRSSGGA